jgi:hypothetical protein
MSPFIYTLPPELNEFAQKRLPRIAINGPMAGSHAVVEDGSTQR